MSNDAKQTPKMGPVTRLLPPACLPSQGKDLEDLKAYYAFVYGMIYAMTFSIIKVVVTMQNSFDGSVYEVGPFYTRQLR